MPPISIFSMISCSVGLELRSSSETVAPAEGAQVAEELELAVSTVSRTVAGKHAQTPWGVFPLKHFFQAGAGGERPRRGEYLCQSDSVRAR